MVYMMMSLQLTLRLCSLKLISNAYSFYDFCPKEAIKVASFLKFHSQLLEFVHPKLALESQRSTVISLNVKVGVKDGPIQAPGSCFINQSWKVPILQVIPSPQNWSKGQPSSKVANETVKIESVNNS